MTKKERADFVVRELERYYPEVGCSLNYSTPLEMLIATQMSAQCTDANVNKVTERLFRKYTCAEDFANARIEELQDDIRSIGLYRNKSKNIISCARMIIDQYDGEVPSTMEELLTLPGTGRKTANLVLGEIFGQPAVVVDTHCIRLTNRIGLVNTEVPEKIEMELKKLIPPDKQLDTCHRFVWYGREVCNARSPKCDLCVISSHCKYGNKIKKQTGK